MSQKNKINANKLLIIDANVLDTEILLKDLRPGYRVIRLDPESEPIAQLTNAVHAHSPVEEIVLVVHAIPGQIHFSGGLVGTEELEWHRQQLQTWRESLSTDAKLCIYACQLAADKEGLAFIDTLKDFTGAEVAASSLQMGDTGKGKNWNFDRFTTFFSASNPFHQDSLLNYAHTLESVISVNRSTSVLHVGEGNSSYRYMEFTVTLSEPAADTVRIYYRTLDDVGTATGEVDYNEASSYIQIAAGQSSGTVYVQVYGDNADEADESVVLELYNPSNAVFPDGVNTLQAIGLIHDDDGVGNDLGLFVGNSEIVEGADGVTREVAVPVHLSRPSDQTLTFQYQTSDGNAIAGQDYTSQTGTVTFLPGQTSAAAIIPIIGDAIDEPSETFSLTVTPTPAIANGSAGATGTITILDGDILPPPEGITVNAGNTANVNEGSLFTRTVSFIDDLDTNADGWTYSVDWGDGSPAETGSIAAGADTFDISRLFADGDASHTVSVTVTDTTGDTDTQQFQLNVNNVAPTIALLGVDTVNTGADYTLNLSAITDPGLDTVISYIVNWGDGSSETYNSAGDVTHVYSTVGNTAITVDLVDEDGTHTNAGSLLVAVNTPPAGITLDAGEDFSLNEGSLFTRTILFTDGEDTDADGWTYSIDWGDSAAENGAIAAGVNSFNISRIFADGDASHTVSVTVTDTAGDTNTQQFQLDVNNVVPTIALSGLPEVDAGVSYTLNLGEIIDPGDDTITSYIVNWGDGSSNTYDTAGEVTHTFATDGNYTISVDLVDEDDTHTAAGTLVVAVNPIIIPDGVSINAGIDAVINEGSFFTRTIIFSDGEDAGSDGWTYSVDWGDGSLAETGSIAAGENTFDISRLFADGDALHTVSVTVTDTAGDTDTQQFQLNVNNVAPTIALLGADTINTGADYMLNLGAITDPGNDTVTSYIVNWGDGSSNIYDTAGEVIHTFAAEGNYTISVDLVDEDGVHTAAGTLAVAVNTVIIPDGVSVNAGVDAVINEGSLFTRTITFNDGEDAGADGWTYSVDWGDGSAVENGVIAAGANTFDIGRLFADGDASHTVSVTVADTAGDTDTRQFVLGVNNVAPVMTLIGDASVDEGSIYTLTGSVFDPGADTITDYIINWGDGTATALTSAEIQALSGNVTHVYADGAGNPLISVDLVDEDGTHTAAGILNVTVNNVAPTIALSGASEVNTGNSYMLNLGAITDPGDDTVTSYIVNWGDGGSDTYNSAGEVTHTFAADGHYTIRVDLIDEDGTHVDAGNLAVSVNASSPAETIRIGDAPLRVSRSDPDAWENAWTNDAVSISHKANYLDTAEAWSSAALHGNNSTVLSGGDIFGGDLGVSGQSLAASTIHQEIDGMEALRFDLDQAATKVTIDLSRLDGNNSTGHFDAGRLQLLDDTGLVVDELIFNADALSGDQQITLDHATGFSSVVLTSGVYNGADFIFGGLSDANGQYLSGPQNQGNGTWNASEYLVDAVTFEFGDITLVGTTA
ncbi:MAG: DUF4347 domain-containing protein [Nitrosomonas sp.]|nr:DUF4347 domain-containing protein [Nitrosomonas sp.]